MELATSVHHVAVGESAVVQNPAEVPGAALPMHCLWKQNGVVNLGAVNLVVERLSAETLVGETLEGEEGVLVFRELLVGQLMLGLVARWFVVGLLYGQLR